MFAFVGFSINVRIYPRRPRMLFHPFYQVIVACTVMLYSSSSLRLGIFICRIAEMFLLVDFC